LFASSTVRVFRFIFRPRRHVCVFAVRSNVRRRRTLGVDNFVRRSDAIFIISVRRCVYIRFVRFPGVTASACGRIPFSRQRLNNPLLRLYSNTVRYAVRSGHCFLFSRSRCVCVCLCVCFFRVFVVRCFFCDVDLRIRPPTEWSPK